MDQASALREAAAMSRAFRVIAITSGKGGVGKTSVATNLGIALGREGRRVLMVDADLGLANVEIMMGLTPSRDLRYVLDGGAVEECITRGPEGVELISGASGVSELTELDSPAKWRILQAFESVAERYDTLILDTAAGIGSNVRFFAGAAEDILVVVGPEPTSLTDAYSLIKVLSTRCGVRRVLVCVNQTRSLEGARKVFRQLHTVASRFLSVVIELAGWIPYDAAVEEAIMAQRPFLITHPMTPASQAVKALSEALLRRQPSQIVTSGGLRMFWRTLLAAEEDV